MQFIVTLRTDVIGDDGTPLKYVFEGEAESTEALLNIIGLSDEWVAIPGQGYACRIRNSHIAAVEVQSRDDSGTQAPGT